MIQATQKTTSIADHPPAPARSAAGESAAFGQMFLEQAAETAQPAAAQSGGESRTGAPQSAAAGADLPVYFAPSNIEACLNRWYMEQIERENQSRLEIYNLALENWRLNSTRHRELGLPELPPPEPPVLQAVQPKPPGWWLQIHNA